jgi:hypothetical protein
VLDAVRPDGRCAEVDASHFPHFSVSRYANTSVSCCCGRF